MGRQPEPPRDPDSLPDSTDPSGPCPHCGRVSNFSIVGSAPLTYDSGWLVGPAGHERVPRQRVSILECQGCQDGITVIEGRADGVGDWRGFHWWPIPGALLTNDAPDSAAAAYGEGVRCLSAGAPNGAAAMFRTALTYMVADKGSDAAKAKGDLKGKIQQMTHDGGPLGSLSEWADHVRLTGNAGAHPDLFGAVSMDEAKDLGRLVRTIIELLYEIPANIARRQAERAP